MSAGRDVCYGSVIDRAMRAYLFVARDVRVRARLQQRSLYEGQQSEIARELGRELGCTRSNAQRYVRTALDLLGFGECDRSVYEGEDRGRRQRRGSNA